MPFEFKRSDLAYREAIRKAGTGETKLIRRAGSSHEYAHVRLQLHPLPTGQGIQLVDNVTGHVAIPVRFWTAIQSGIRRALDHGAWGFPLTDVLVTVADGSYHDVDSTAHVFEDAANQATTQAMIHAHPAILEPMANVLLNIPEFYVGDVMGDLTKRRGRILDIQRGEKAGDWQVAAFAPQAELLDYERSLESLTGGAGTGTVSPAGHEELPSACTSTRYCTSCRREFLVPKIQDEIFSDHCLNCNTPFEPPDPAMGGFVGVT